jgi:hypothetical protein
VKHSIWLLPNIRFEFGPSLFCYTATREWPRRNDEATFAHGVSVTRAARDSFGGRRFIPIEPLKGYVPNAGREGT